MRTLSHLFRTTFVWGVVLLAASYGRPASAQGLVRYTLEGTVGRLKYSNALSGVTLVDNTFFRFEASVADFASTWGAFSLGRNYRIELGQVTAPALGLLAAPILNDDVEVFLFDDGVREQFAFDLILTATATTRTYDTILFDSSGLDFINGSLVPAAFKHNLNGVSVTTGGSWRRAFKLEDGSTLGLWFGNFSASIATETSASPQAPVITCPEPVVMECTNGGLTTLTARVEETNGLPVEVLWFVNGERRYTNSVPGTSPRTSAEVAFPGEFLRGTNVVKLIAVSRNSVSAPCFTTVTVRDTTPPIVICPTNLTVGLTSAAGAAVHFSAPATDLCSASVGVLCTPPPGSLFPTGTTLVTCVATDEAGNSTPCGFAVTVLGALSSKELVLLEMETLQAARAGERLGELNRAIERLRRSINADWWLDEMHPKTASGVFGNEATAVYHLKKLLRARGDGIPDETLQQWIDRLVGVDHALADLQINEAIEAGAAPKSITLASSRLSGGDLAGNRGQSFRAIRLYRDAWRAASRALARIQTP